ncbi:hypothetical protein PTKIN_Ptkin08bG0066700 [Pterospermum kingtungense]
MGNPHIVVIPYPAQGHVIPHMELSQNLAKQGFKISFVNTEFSHKRIVDAYGKKVDENGLIHLVSLPDGLEDWEDRNQFGKLAELLRQIMRRELKEFMEKVNRSEDNKITCVVADLNMGFVLEVAAELGIPSAALWTCIPVDKHKTIQLSPTMPTIHPRNILCLAFDDSNTQRFIFDLAKSYIGGVEMADWVLCNSSLDLEHEGFTLVPKVLPIGPLSAGNRLGNLSGNFWPEDTTCLQWLDEQPAGSVVYVAFGSFTVFDEIQFQELALGLELSNRPFLWAVRPEITKGNDCIYPEGFEERVGSQGKMVGWAPQGAVLSHPSIACFLSHCGWNSTIEGLSNGVPLLCWPYFGDQFLNESYICDICKVGLKFERDRRGIITKEEIKNKIEKLLGDRSFKTRVAQLKEMVVNSVNEGGSSDREFKKFVEWMKS